MRPFYTFLEKKCEHVSQADMTHIQKKTISEALQDLDDPDSSGGDKQR